jgi:hypothetical protein
VKLQGKAQSHVLAIYVTIENQYLFVCIKAWLVDSYAVSISVSTLTKRVLMLYELVVFLIDFVEIFQVTH